MPLLRAGDVIEREWLAPRGGRKVRIAFTREDWPAGEVAELEIWRSDHPRAEPYFILHLAGGPAFKKGTTETLLESQIVWKVPRDLEWVRARLIVKQDFRTTVSRSVI